MSHSLPPWLLQNCLLPLTILPLSHFSTPRLLNVMALTHLGSQGSEQAMNIFS